MFIHHPVNPHLSQLFSNKHEWKINVYDTYVFIAGKSFDNGIIEQQQQRMLLVNDVMSIIFNVFHLCNTHGIAPCFFKNANEFVFSFVCCSIM